MDSLELIIRKRLGQKSFNPVSGRRHKRFDFSGNKKGNKKIMELFNDFKFKFEDNENRHFNAQKSDYDFDIYCGNFYDIFKLYFYKGTCTLTIEQMIIDSDLFECEYYDLILNDYTGLGTVEIIKNIILEHSANYREIVRDENINMILDENKDQ